MNNLLGWTLRIIGAILWLFMFVMFKNSNPGWVSDAARIGFYTITSLGGLACFATAHFLLGSSPKTSGVVVGVVLPSDNNDD